MCRQRLLTTLGCVILLGGLDIATSVHAAELGTGSGSKHAAQTARRKGNRQVETTIDVASNGGATIRREPASPSHAGARSASGPKVVNLAAFSTEELPKGAPEVESEDQKEACRRKMAELSGRAYSLISAGNISAATAAAEDHPCQVLAAAYGKALPGHTIIKKEDGTRVQVPITSTAPPDDYYVAKAVGFGSLGTFVMVLACGTAGIMLNRNTARKKGKTPEADSLADNEDIADDADDVVAESEEGQEVEALPQF